MAVAFFSFKNRKSILHEIPSMMKILIAFFLCIVCFKEIEREFVKLSVCIFFTFGLFFLGKCNFETLRPLPFVILLGFFVTALRSFIFFPEFSFSHEGLVSGILYSVRLLTATLASQIIFETTSGAQIQCGMEQIEDGIAKIFPPVKKLHAALLVSLAINFIPLVFETWNKVHLASRARSSGKKNIFSAVGTLLAEMEGLLSCLIFKAETKRKAILNRGKYD